MRGWRTVGTTLVEREHEATLLLLLFRRYPGRALSS